MKNLRWMAMTFFTTFMRRIAMIRMLAGPLVGALLGFIYYRTVGCSTGSCPLTSNPWISTLYGAVMGFILVSMK